MHPQSERVSTLHKEKGYCEGEAKTRFLEFTHIVLYLQTSAVLSSIGTYLAAEADGFLGRDVMEFLVKEDVVTYRSMARKVVYLYPFTTPIGDFDGQQKRLKTLEEELGWSIPSFENTFYDSEVDRDYDY